MTKVKKFLYNLVVLSAVIFSFSSCAEKMEKEEAPEVLAPAQIVQIDQAKEMYDRYTDRRVSLIQRYEDSINRSKGNNKIRQEKNDRKDTDITKDSKDFDVARYVAYDYETIKQYLAFIEQEAKKANVEISSLRFYFSNYPDKPFFDNKDSILHPRQNSIMLSPTLKKGERDHLFYVEAGAEGQEAILLSDSFNNLKSQGMGSAAKEKNMQYASFVPNLTNSNSTTTTNSSFYTGKSLTMNRGGGVPPPYHEN